jgi:hypothetical protein
LSSNRETFFYSQFAILIHQKPILLFSVTNLKKKTNKRAVGNTSKASQCPDEENASRK